MIRRKQRGRGLTLVRLIRKVRLKDFIESNGKNLKTKNNHKSFINIMKKMQKIFLRKRMNGQKCEMLVVLPGTDLSKRS